MERSTAWCSKETAEFSEKKRLHEIGFGIKHCRSHCCCPPDPFTSAGALSLGHWVWLFLQVTLGTANFYLLKCPLEHSIFLLSISLNKNAYQHLAHKESLPFFHKLKKYILGCPLKSLLFQISEFSSWWMFPNPYGCWWWEPKLLTTQKVALLPLRLWVEEQGMPLARAAESFSVPPGKDDFCAPSLCPYSPDLKGLCGVITCKPTF